MLHNIIVCARRRDTLIAYTELYMRPATHVIPLRMPRNPSAALHWGLRPCLDTLLYENNLQSAYFQYILQSLLKQSLVLWIVSMRLEKQITKTPCKAPCTPWPPVILFATSILQGVSIVNHDLYTTLHSSFIFDITSKIGYYLSKLWITSIKSQIKPFRYQKNPATQPQGTLNGNSAAKGIYRYIWWMSKIIVELAYVVRWNMQLSAVPLTWYCSNWITMGLHSSTIISDVYKLENGIVALNPRFEWAGNKMAYIVRNIFIISTEINSVSIQMGNLLCLIYKCTLWALLSNRCPYVSIDSESKCWWN